MMFIVTCVSPKAGKLWFTDNMPFPLCPFIVSVASVDSAVTLISVLVSLLLTYAVYVFVLSS